MDLGFAQLATGWCDNLRLPIPLLSALTGGFLAGWGVMIWCLSVWVYDHAPEAVRRTALAGILTWFCLDSAGSIASGNSSNALANILVLLIAVGPLWWPARQQATTGS